MGTRAGVGTSNHHNPRIAAKEAVALAVERAGIQQPSFVLVFSAVGYEQPVLLEAIRALTGKVPLCGSSGEGVISQRLADESNFVVGVMVVESDELRMITGHATGLKANPEQVGAELAASLDGMLTADAKALLLFADGITCNYDRLMAGLYDRLPEAQQLPILGGLSGENYRMLETFQYCNDAVVSDGISWALLSGSAQLALAVNHGSLPIGSVRVITRCQGNQIQAIDGQPALTIIKEYVSDADVADSGDAIIPLALGFPAPAPLDGESPLLLRPIRSTDTTTGTIFLPSEVREGQRFWMARRDTEAVSAGLLHVRDSIRTQLGGRTPKLVLQFDCASRGKLLLREEQKLTLLRKLQQGISSTAPWLGVYTYGEFGPVGKHNNFHSYSVVLAAFY
jgi:hypothetical protein